jgi:four helix bundle protein
MTGNSTFRDLVVWQKAMDLVETCYAVTKAFPRAEEFVLGAQLPRAAISVPSNIAEGQRLSKAAFRSYLKTALASEAEIETQLELARRLGFIETRRMESTMREAEEVARMIRGLVASLSNR